MLIQPKEIEINGKTYIISKFPAIIAREIIMNYPIANMPKVGNYAASEEIMLKLMKHVAVPRENGEPLVLSNRDLINNHVLDWETLVKLEWLEIEYNCSFFQNGKALDLLEKLPGFLAKLKITETLTGLSGKSSTADKQPSTN